MYYAHSLINVATCHGMSNLGFHPHLMLSATPGLPCYIKK
jgi:hypothetical protein